MLKLVAIHDTDDGCPEKFELYMGVLSLAMCNIRADAIQPKYAIKDANPTTKDVLKTINQIEKNRRQFASRWLRMTSGIACDAAYLLHHGVDDRWPTGICKRWKASNKQRDATTPTVQFHFGSFAINSLKMDAVFKEHFVYTDAIFSQELVLTSLKSPLLHCFAP
ncbi:hypothetical protein [Limnohabitans sp.]|uniref:hypothetical protein n=1 Tax=Limnohabitans sp. TaxID=1907725 RepID=UPI00286F5B01|nr:hypothetical protein [Limnohabitans sp.]